MLTSRDSDGNGTVELRRHTEVMLLFIINHEETQFGILSNVRYGHASRMGATRTFEQVVQVAVVTIAVLKHLDGVRYEPDGMHVWGRKSSWERNARSERY